MKKKTNRLPLIRFWLIVLAVYLIGIYFRTYTLHKASLLTGGQTIRTAERIVKAQIKLQMRRNIDRQYPIMSELERDKLADQEATKVLKTEKSRFDYAVRNLQESLKASIAHSASRHYLLESDPYYYYSLTKQILKSDTLSDRKDGNLFFNSLRLAPKGAWDWMTLHPFLGKIWYQMMLVINPKVTLMEALCYFPLMILLPVTIAFFILCRKIGFDLLESGLTGVIFVTAPVFLQRSAFGWFDTDPYNLFFPIVLLTLFLYTITHPARAQMLGVTSGLLLVLYSFFWAGWTFMLYLLIVMCAIVAWHDRLESKKNRIFGLPSIKYLAWLLPSIAVSLAVFLGVNGSYMAFVKTLTSLSMFSIREIDVWPNMFLTVGEANSINLNKLIFITCNYVTFAISCLGLLWSVLGCVRKKTGYSFGTVSVLVVFLIPLFIMSLRTERFSLFLVLPISLFFGFGVKSLRRGIEALIDKTARSSENNQRFKRMTTAFILLALTLPVPLVFAHVVARNMPEIMNDTWYEALEKIKAKSSNNTIVVSWWPPGYFIQSIAERRTILDGGSQHRPESFWVAKALLANDEKVCVGILRMLMTSGNDALTFLQDLNIDLPDAVDLLLEIVGKHRSDARKILQIRFAHDQVDKLLTLTHGAGTPSSGLVFIYSELIEMNPVMTMISRWDFRKARNIRNVERQEQKSIWISANQRSKKYIDQMLAIIGDFPKFTKESPLVRQEGDWLYFDNGFRFNLNTKESVVLLPKEKVETAPNSVYVVDAGRFIDYPNLSKKQFPISALVYRRGDSYYSLLADRSLVTSMLFRMYYGDGAGLQALSPFISSAKGKDGTVIKVFQINWNSE